MKLTGFWQANLDKMLEVLGEERVKEILSSFSCPKNEEVEYFLRKKAIEFSKQAIAKTHLVFASYQEEPVLVGYYSLANKVFTIRKTAKMSSKLKRRILRFSSYDEELKQYSLAIPLIAQLGKNYTNGYNSLIEGAELLEMAFEKIRKVQQYTGGKFAFLECADTPKIKAFYEDNGFVFLNNRTLSAGEIGLDGCTYYLQMIKFFGTN